MTTKKEYWAIKTHKPPTSATMAKLKVLGFDLDQDLDMFIIEAAKTKKRTSGLYF